jgi:1-acyl-sn-glycerol-3-phosphate acyltransferase
MKRLAGIEDFLHHLSHLVDLDRKNAAIFAFVAGGLDGIGKGLIDRPDPVPEKIVKQSRSLFIAPEGTRSPTGQMLPFKKGAFHIAVQGGIPIYPILVHGAFELMPKSRIIARPGVICLKFLDPVPTRGLGTDDVDSLLTEIRERMISEFEKLQRS